MRISIFLKVIILFTISFSSYSQSLGVQRIDVSQPRKVIYKGKLSVEQLNKFKAFIKITSEIDLSENVNFVINYRQPENSCFYDHYKSRECTSVNWFKENVYKTISFNAETLNLFYQSKMIKNNKCEVKYDLSNFIYNNFMKENQLCFGLLIVNSLGEYRLLIGEYVSNDVNEFLKELKIN